MNFLAPGQISAAGSDACVGIKVTFVVKGGYDVRDCWDDAVNLESQ